MSDRRERVHHVYIMASHRRTLYVGVTSKLDLRVWNHKNKTIAGFTRKYNCVNLVYFEAWARAAGAIAREKQIKGWTRAKKMTLIESKNPSWKDLSEGWFQGWSANPNDLNRQRTVTPKPSF